MKDSFLWRNRVLLISGLLLLFSAHLLSTGVRDSGPAVRPQALLMEILRPVQMTSTRFFDGTLSFYRNYLELLGVREENERIKAELARLKTDAIRMQTLETENRRLTSLLDLKEALAQRVLGADVIGSDATGLSRSLIISRGSNDGLQTNMAVVSVQGVVGKIIAVSPNAARVLLINDHNAALDAFDQRSRARGIVAGVVDGQMVMKYVERTEDLKPGDTLVTSSLDGIFPRGLLVGTVTSVEHGGSGLFLGVEVTPSVDFRHLEQVLVVTEQPPRMTEQAKN